MGRQRWIYYCAFAAIALCFAAWEIFERRRGNRWPVRSLVVAGAISLIAGLCGYAMREATVTERASVPVVLWMFAVVAAVPYVLLHADDEMRSDP